MQQHGVVSQTWRPDDAWDPGNPENRDRTRALVAELRTRLLAWDPIGVSAAPEAQDEYDCLISPLMHRLHDRASTTDITDWLIHEVSDHFGMRPDKKRERALARDLAQWWSRATASTSE